MAIIKPNALEENGGNMLMIAYYFHPDLEIGSVRSTKFAKYLPLSGWHISVLTIKDKYRKNIGAAPLGFECKVYHTRRWPVPRDIYLRLKPFLARIKGRKTIHTTDSNENSVLYQHPTGVPLWKRLFYSLSWMPDDKIGWFVPAIIKGFRVIRSEKIDVIYSSGPPWTCHVIGLVLKILTGKKWVADFRDPWYTLDKTRLVSTSLTRRFENYLLIDTLNRADLILGPVPEMHDQMIKKYGDLISSKFKLITNGFDDDDFKGRSKNNRMPNTPVRFLYAGSLFSGRDPAILLKAISELFKSGVLQTNEISIEFRGGLPEDMPGVDNFVASHELSEVVQFNPPVARDKYIDLLFDADVLLLMQGADASTARPAKVYDYLATGNLIMAITPDGATRNFLRDFDNVIYVDPDNKEMIKDTILNAMARIKSGKGYTKPNTDMLNNYTSRSLAKTLGELLRGLACRNDSNTKGKQ
jgi:glycosyltransferase involved in cell wall biosynthesis